VWQSRRVCQKLLKIVRRHLWITPYAYFEINKQLKFWKNHRVFHLVKTVTLPQNVLYKCRQKKTAARESPPHLCRQIFSCPWNFILKFFQIKFYLCFVVGILKWQESCFSLLEEIWQKSNNWSRMGMGMNFKYLLFLHYSEILRLLKLKVLVLVLKMLSQNRLPLPSSIGMYIFNTYHNFSYYQTICHLKQILGYFNFIGLSSADSF